MSSDAAKAPLRVALAGAGYFARFHVDGWRRNPDVELAAIADPDTARAAQLVEDVTGNAHAISVFEDAGAMLGTVRPDIFDIAAPPAAHLELIGLGIAAGARVIVCQKPFCGDLETARAAVRMARDAGATIVVHENFRFQPWYRRIKAAIDSGEVGDLYQITFRLRPGDGQGPDAYLARQPYFQAMDRFLVHETAVHFIDTFRFLLGEPQSVFADLRRLNPAIAGEDAGFILYRYADGRRALFDGNRLADHVADNPRLTMGDGLIEGSKAQIALDGDGRLHRRGGGEKAWQGLSCDYPRTGFGGDCVYALQRHVSDHALTGAPLENRAEAYLRNMEIEEAVYRASASGCVVDLTG